jgi:hypothetical protein
MPPARFLLDGTSRLLIRSLLFLFFFFFFLFYGFDYLAAGKSVSDLNDLDLHLLSDSAFGDEDDESFDFGYSVSTSADFGDGDIVFLTYFDRFGFERPRPAETATSVAASAPVTRILSTPLRLVTLNKILKTLTYIPMP